MRHLRTYEGFAAIREDIEDCCLEIFDLGLNFDIENCQFGKKRDKQETVGFIKLVGEILNKKELGFYTGIYTNKIDKLEEIVSNWSQEKRISLNHSGEIVTNKPIINTILNVIPSVLNKLRSHVIGNTEIKFTLNAYSVERGTCIVINIEWGDYIWTNSQGKKVETKS